MFGDLLGNMKEQEKALQEKLSTIKFEESIQDGAIRVKANAARAVEQITIDPEFIKQAEVEEVEDLLLVVLNRALEKAAAMQAEEMQKSIKDMLPPGMDNLFG